MCVCMYTHMYTTDIQIRAPVIILIILQAISANDTPFNNMFLYDGVQGTGIVETLTKN